MDARRDDESIVDNDELSIVESYDFVYQLVNIVVVEL